LFQFTRGTWLEMMHRYGSQYGYGDLADKITVTDSGKATVKDPAAERRLLALREDPEASGLMAAAYAQNNAATLENQLGRVPDSADLYLAHFLGASGASTLLNAATDTPRVAAETLLPAAAKANRSIFYTPDGAARSAADVAALVRGRFDTQMHRFADSSESAMGDTPDTAVAALPRGGAAAATRAATVNMAHALNRMAEHDKVAKDLMQMMVLEEMAKLIALRPMQMMGDEDEENADTTALSPKGFQGEDFAAALMRSTAEPGAASQLPKHHRGPSAYLPAAALSTSLDDLL
jgi:hypothetical protein